MSNKMIRRKPLPFDFSITDKTALDQLKGMEIDPRKVEAIALFHIKDENRQRAGELLTGPQINKRLKSLMEDLESARERIKKTADNEFLYFSLRSGFLHRLQPGQEWVKQELMNIADESCKADINDAVAA